MIREGGHNDRIHVYIHLIGFQWELEAAVGCLLWDSIQPTKIPAESHQPASKPLRETWHLLLAPTTRTSKLLAWVKPKIHLSKSPAPATASSRGIEQNIKAELVLASRFEQSEALGLSKLEVLFLFLITLDYDVSQTKLAVFTLSRENESHSLIRPSVRKYVFCSPYIPCWTISFIACFEKLW